MSKILKSDNAVKAVYEDDFQQFLKQIGILDEVTKGSIKCKFCGEPVSLDNIVSVFPEGGTIKVVCDKPQCITAMNNYFNEKQ